MNPSNINPNKLNKIKYFLNIIPRLGIINLIIVFIYRVKCKTGYYLFKFPFIPYMDKGPIFQKNTIKNIQGISSDSTTVIINNAEKIKKGTFQYFSNKSYYLGSPPNWFLDPINNKNINNININ